MMGRTGCEVKNETEGMDIFFSFFFLVFFPIKVIYGAGLVGQWENCVSLQGGHSQRNFQ